ncbi:unnamed protein product [Sympodiomycopsis kandeliae]
MPPRRSSGRLSQSSAKATSTPTRSSILTAAVTKADPDSPGATSSHDTISGNNTTRSSTRGLDTPLTPATSVSDDEGGASKSSDSKSRVKKDSSDEAEANHNISVEIPTRPANLQRSASGSSAALVPSPASGKRKRNGFVTANQVKVEQSSDDDVTFVSESLSRAPSRKSAARPSRPIKANDSSAEDEDVPLSSTSAKGKQRQKDQQEADAQAAFAIADEIRNYVFSEDEDAAAAAAAVAEDSDGSLTDIDSDDDFKPSGSTAKGKGKGKAVAQPASRKRAAGKSRRNTRVAKPRKGSSSKVKIDASDNDDDAWEDDAQEFVDDFEDDSDSDSDFIAGPPTKKRGARRRAVADDDSQSELSDIDDDDDLEAEGADIVADQANDGGVGTSTSTGRGHYAEDLQYETKKQRAARLRSEKYEARRKKPRSLTHYQKTVRDIEYNHPELKGVWERLKRQPTFDKSKKAPQPEGLTISLLPFQLEGLNWLKQQEQGEWKGGILADEMGMGKTIQMISLFLSDRKKPTLVVAPTVAIMQWRNEIAKYTSDFKVLVWHGATRESDVAKLKEYDVILTSYAVLESSFRKQEVGFKRKGELLKEKSAIHSIKWHRIVLDEAHNIKERATNTAKGAFALEGSYRWCLSGTPLQNRVGELYSMIRFLSGDPYAYYYCKRCPCKSLHWQFSNRRSCDKCGHTPMHHVCLWNIAILRPIQRDGTTQGDGQISFARLRTLLEKIMLRRTKLERADDMGLPPRTLVVRRDYFNEEETDLYDSLYRDVERKFSTYIDAGTVLNNYSNIFTLLTRMRQLACHPDLVLRSKTGLQQKLLGAAADQSIHLCRICAEEATDPISSKCRHVFCRECVRQYLESAAGVMSPDCPYCHAKLAIDLEQEALEEVQSHETRQGILGKIDLEKWRSSTKIEALVEELNSVRREDSTIKSIVFSQFVNFLDLITFRLQRAGFKVCRLEGNMTPEARDRTIRYFMETPDVTVFLVSLKAGGVALNLTEASRVYLMDPWWNGAVSAQAMDRIHRLGQRRPIVIKQMIIEDSIEARMLELQEKKQNMVNATLANDDSAVSRLSVADLKFLFQL